MTAARRSSSTPSCACSRRSAAKGTRRTCASGRPLSRSAKRSAKPPRLADLPSLPDMAAIVELYLVRHAIAAERGPKYPDDRLRPLIPEGVSRFKDAVRGLAELDITIDRILTSPLTRAEETAAILSAGFKSRIPVDVLEALAPGGKPAAIVEAVTRVAKKHRRIALVGHEPDLGELAARLLGARGIIEFRKGAVCAIDLDGATPGGPGTLRFLLPPKAL